MFPSSRPVLRGRPVGVVLSAVLLAGCAASSSTRGLDEAIGCYDDARYEEGFEAANRTMRTASGHARDRAGYVAGLCAYRMGRLEDAELRFSVAAASRDAETAGKAGVMLGHLRERQGRHSDASRLFGEAAGKLGGPGGEQARRHAEAAARRGGESGPVLPQPAARHELAVARAAGPPAADTPERLFTLQAGAFSERARAQAVAYVLRRDADRTGVGRVRIIPDHDGKGQALYLVQVGRFSSRDEAVRARQRLRHPEYIVTVLPDDADG